MLLVGACAVAFGAFIRAQAAQRDTPFVGFALARHAPSLLIPLRPDVADAGLRLGTIVIGLNGHSELPADALDTPGRVHREVGQTNKLSVLRPDGLVQTFDVPVTVYTWADVVYISGLRVGVAAVYLAIALVAFFRRPFYPACWALLISTAAFGLWLVARDVPLLAQHTGLIAALGAVLTVAPLHWAHTLPAAVPAARLRRRVLAVYGLALVPGVLLAYVLAKPDGAYAGGALLFVCTLAGAGAAAFVLRCVDRATRDANALVRQRARFLLAGIGFGVAPLVVVLVVRLTTARLWGIPDGALVTLSVLFPLALAVSAARRNLLDTHAVVQRTLAYGGSALLLAAGGRVGIMGLHALFARMGRPTPQAAVPTAIGAGLLLATLLWPRVQRTIEGWIYPDRHRLREHRKALERRLDRCVDAQAVLEVLAAAPATVCGSRTGVAFVLAGLFGPRTVLRAHGGVDYRGSDRLAREPVVRILMALREPLTAERPGADAQFADVAEAATAGFARLQADVLLPVVHEGSVVGGIGIGPALHGRAHDPAALALVSRLAAHGLQVALNLPPADAEPAPAGEPEPAPADPAPRTTPTPGELQQVQPPRVVAHMEVERPAAQPGPQLPTVPAAITGTRYKVLGPLGQGGYKCVYLALDTLLDRHVALSVFKPEALAAQGRRRIQREAQAMAQLGDHPHIVNVYDMGEVDGHVYLVSQYMAGGSLRDRLLPLRGTGVTLPGTGRIMHELCEALHFVHAQGIVHRDVKPGNVWMAGNATATAPDSVTPTHDSAGVRLGDFGLAFRPELSRLTDAGVMMGTILYMAPEQVRGEMPAPPWDVYSLGVVLYEMLTGARPFTGESAVAVAHQHLAAIPKPPTLLNKEVSPEAETLVLAMLAKDGEDRPTAKEVQVSLQTITLP